MPLSHVHLIRVSYKPNVYQMFLNFINHSETTLPVSYWLTSPLMQTGIYYQWPAL